MAPSMPKPTPKAAAWPVAEALVEEALALEDRVWATEEDDVVRAAVEERELVVVVVFP